MGVNNAITGDITIGGRWHLPQNVIVDKQLTLRGVTGFGKLVNLNSPVTLGADGIMLLKALK